MKSKRPRIPGYWIAIALGGLVWFAQGSGLLRASPWEFGLCLLMALCCGLPMLAWYRRGMHEVPVVETLCLIHLPWYVLPYLNAHPDLMRYPEGVRTTAGWALAAYVAAIGVGGAVVRRGVARKRSHRPGLMDRRLHLAALGGLLPIMYGVWVGFDLLLVTGNLQIPKAILALARASTSSVGLIALFFMAYQLGMRERITGRAVKWPLATVVTLHALVAAASGFLVNTALVLFGALAPYCLGRKRLAIVPLLIAGACLNFLHLGKADMRTRFWGPDGLNRGAVNPIEVYAYWVPASWDAMLRGQDREDDESSDVALLTRASLMHMLALVVSDTPSFRPHLDGRSYGMIPGLMIPRLLWPEKPRASAPTELLGIYYGLMTEASNEYTSVTFGQATEAWANFGWSGMVGVGFCFGILAGVGNRLSWGRTPESYGFLLAGILLSRVWDIGNAAGTVLLSTFQALAFSMTILFLLSAPGRNRAASKRPPGRGNAALGAGLGAGTPVAGGTSRRPAPGRGGQ